MPCLNKKINQVFNRTWVIIERGKEPALQFCVWHKYVKSRYIMCFKRQVYQSSKGVLFEMQESIRVLSWLVERASWYKQKRLLMTAARAVDVHQAWAKRVTICVDRLE